MTPLARGLVQVFTGDGRGKTSAALGVALRAAGHGLRVHIIQFMKGDYPYGERCALARLPSVDITVFGHEHFVDPASIRPEERAEAERALARAWDVIAGGDYDVVILDEVNVAAAWNLIGTEDVLAVIRGRPQTVEVLLTGRYAPPSIIQAADLVTEMANIKHPYQRGMLSRRGIDC